MRPLIVIPTYNERKNLQILVPQIFKAVPKASILVVDDASPDGTAWFARRMARRYPRRIYVLRRTEKRGLGSAYVAGFRHALLSTEFDPIIQMDADGSHDPSALPVFLQALKRVDVVVGSRYFHGLRVINWPWSRVFLSLAANWYAKVVTGVPITDLTSGYNGWRRRILKRVHLDQLRCNGYAFQIELKYLCHRMGARIREVPIIFAGRVEGESKLSRSVVFEAIWAVWRMRFIS